VQQIAFLDSGESPKNDRKLLILNDNLALATLEWQVHKVHQATYTLDTKFKERIWAK